MAGRGRPTVEDKRTNQYRVLMNDEEDKMLDYCSKKTGLPKSQIFRKGIEVLYQQVRLNEYGQDYDGHISLRRIVRIVVPVMILTLKTISRMNAAMRDRWARKLSMYLFVRIMNVLLVDRDLLWREVYMNIQSELMILKKFM